tara:strand:+ start:703 stop:1161 length:459 start_codon:yes stop_codon:yes gene_type:complete
MTQSFDIKIIEGISAQTIRFFKKKRSVKEFLDLVAESGSVALASSKWKLSPLEVQEIIKQDIVLQRLTSLSLKLALEIAEGVLYERAVNGYTEETIVDGVKTGEKKKYSDSCLLSYLKANSGKYSGTKIGKTPSNLEQAYDIEIPAFEEVDG